MGRDGRDVGLPRGTRRDGGAVAELGGTDTGVPLDELLSGLDDANARLVLDAIDHALTHGRRR